MLLFVPLPLIISVSCGLTPMCDLRANVHGGCLTSCSDVRADMQVPGLDSVPLLRLPLPDLQWE